MGEVGCRHERLEVGRTGQRAPHGGGGGDERADEVGATALALPAPGERSASTSNRNFEGRQGKGGRTHLVSPPVAAATAIRGTLSSPADL